MGSTTNAWQWGRRQRPPLKCSRKLTNRSVEFGTGGTKRKACLQAPDELGERCRGWGFGER